MFTQPVRTIMDPRKLILVAGSMTVRAAAELMKSRRYGAVLIKANIPARISYQVSSRIDSRTILDQMGAESLLGQGDMLYLAPGTGLPTRVHGAFVADAEVHRVAEYLRSRGEPQYVEGLLDAPESEGDESAGGQPGGEADPLYDQPVEIV